MKTIRQVFTYGPGCGIVTGKQYAKIETVRPDGQPLVVSVGRSMERRNLFMFDSGNATKMPHGPDGTIQMGNDDLDAAIEIALAHCLTAEPNTRANLTNCEGFRPLVNGVDYRGTLCAICGCKESEHAATHHHPERNQAMQAIDDYINGNLSNIKSHEHNRTVPNLQVRLP